MQRRIEKLVTPFWLKTLLFLERSLDRKNNIYTNSTAAKPARWRKSTQLKRKI
jgi:hypothetical protein